MFYILLHHSKGIICNSSNIPSHQYLGKCQTTKPCIWLSVTVKAKFEGLILVVANRLSPIPCKSLNFATIFNFCFDRIVFNFFASECIQGSDEEIANLLTAENLTSSILGKERFWNNIYILPQNLPLKNSFLVDKSGVPLVVTAEKICRFFYVFPEIYKYAVKK